MEYTPGSIVSTGHIVLTGPITGTVTLDDGTVVDVSGEAVEVSSPEEANAVAHAVALRYQTEGHPQVEGDFVYDQPEGA